MIEKAQYRANEKAHSMIEPAMCGLRKKRDEHVRNARAVRNLVEHVQQEHADRLSSISEPTREQLLAIEASDLQGAQSATLSRPARDDQGGTHET